MRIVSLLPSATEIVCALGLEHDLVGITCDCDYPPAVRDKRVVSQTSLPAGLDPAAIDAAVRAQTETASSLYHLDEDALRDLRPDVVITQDLCAVCAVDSGSVSDALEYLGCRAEVVSLDPHTLDDVIESIVTVGRATAHDARAAVLVELMSARLARVRSAVEGAPSPQTLILEWTDPPFNAGHWVPDMIVAAGGAPSLATSGAYSVPITWDAIASAHPEVVIVAPCGYELDASVREATTSAVEQGLAPTPAARDGRVWAIDASSYVARPGPRLVDGVELLAGMLHPDRWPAPEPPDAALVGADTAASRAGTSRSTP